MRVIVFCIVLMTSAAMSGVTRGDLTNTPPCAAGESYLRVSTAEHRLYLCEHSQVSASYPVTLGSAPGAKQREGDRRTPRGRYRLSPARRSSKFGWFVGVGYPSAAQRPQGYTGSAVGVHGPPRQLARLGVSLPSWILALDWTDGCIAVSTDTEMETIVHWLARTRARAIVIE